VAICAALAAFTATTALATETCQFAGTTDYAGHVSVITTALADRGIVRVGVAVRFEATTGLWLHLRYLVEEISEWRNGALLRLDANTRYVFAGRVMRQQWDEFRTAAAGLQAHRIEGKRSAQFSRQFPGFARHWDLNAFGGDWLDDYVSAAPERRPDLDLHRRAHDAAVQTPFALAFYWVRFLPPTAQRAQVFLPGFKADKLAELAMSPVPADHGVVWRAALHHPYLSAAPPSSATAAIAADGHLQLLTFELHGSAGSARGTLHLAGCRGTAAR
jgi:hypothetical protein